MRNVARNAGSSALTLLRSGALNISVVMLSAAYLVFLPAFLAPRSVGRAIIASYIRIGSWLLRAICGLSYEVRGRENLPAGPVLIASKHQSAWEDVLFAVIFDSPTMVLRQDLFRIPLSGWVMMKLGHIGVDRSGDIRNVHRMLEKARVCVAEGRSIAIFPEGTRALPGEKLPYQPGVSALYRALNVPCVPVALNSGLYWPRKRTIYRPGRIIVEILPAIEPGLDRGAFLGKLEERIETASNRLANPRTIAPGPSPSVRTAGGVAV